MPAARALSLPGASPQANAGAQPRKPKATSVANDRAAAAAEALKAGQPRNTNRAALAVWLSGTSLMIGGKHVFDVEAIAKRFKVAIAD
eukprot:3907447-Pleurochrysis_carterae.AAC.1